jgi:hypothetical protein
MLLSQLARPVIPASLLLACTLLACTHSVPAPPHAPTTASVADYRTVQPEVSLSRTAQEAHLKQVFVDPNADVMAEILAIPPGR